MLTPDNNFAVKSHDFIAGSRNQQYDRIITELSTRQSTSIPLFSEATTQAIRLTESPISILSLVGDRGCQIGAIGGLELLYKLPTNANLLLELAGIEYCHHQTMICDRSFAISNFQEHPELNNTALFRVYGIRSYLGIPIITAAGDRLGVISILDFTPHQFSDSPEEILPFCVGDSLPLGTGRRYANDKLRATLVQSGVDLRQRDIDILQLVSRWLASEFERKFLSQAQLDRRLVDLHDSVNLTLQEQNNHRFDDKLAILENIEKTEKDRTELVVVPEKISIERDLPLTYPQIKAEIQFKLITHLAQKLRTPLTSVLGMASVLQQEIYGSLSIKQKDYLGIIHSSGQELVSIVDEIAQLVAFDAEVSALANCKQDRIDLKSVDLEMLCQLAIQNLEPLLHQKQQQMVLDFPESNRLWLLNKDNVRQIIYYLSLSLIQGSGTRHQISIKLANLTDARNERLHQRLQLQITTTDPQPILLVGVGVASACAEASAKRNRFTTSKRKSVSTDSKSIDNDMGQDLRVSLGLSLSYTLASLHGGNIELMPNRRGYLLSLPTTSKDAAA
jgi:signal transduction histidine kinase